MLLFQDVRAYMPVYHLNILLSNGVGDNSLLQSNVLFCAAWPMQFLLQFTRNNELKSLAIDIPQTWSETSCFTK